MFEPWLKGVDSLVGGWVGACKTATDVAGVLSQRGAQEGRACAGEPGAAVGSAMGSIYGGVVGFWFGLVNGAMRGAKDQLHQEPPPERHGKHRGGASETT